MITLLDSSLWVDFTLARCPAPHRKFIDRSNRYQGEVRGSAAINHRARPQPGSCSQRRPLLAWICSQVITCSSAAAPAHRDQQR